MTTRKPTLRPDGRRLSSSRLDLPTACGTTPTAVRMVGVVEIIGTIGRIQAAGFDLRRHVATGGGPTIRTPEPRVAGMMIGLRQAGGPRGTAGVAWGPVEAVGGQLVMSPLIALPLVMSPRQPLKLEALLLRGRKMMQWRPGEPLARSRSITSLSSGLDVGFAPGGTSVARGAADVSVARRGASQDPRRTLAQRRMRRRWRTCATS